ncbi:MAG: hypothetical protein ABI358_09095 [Ginsengibacter sp.]
MPHRYFVVDVFYGRRWCFNNYTFNGKLPCDKSSNCKPGKEFENGVVRMDNQQWIISNE